MNLSHIGLGENPPIHPDTTSTVVPQLLIVNPPLYHSSSTDAPSYNESGRVGHATPAAPHETPEHTMVTFETFVLKWEVTETTPTMRLFTTRNATTTPNPCAITVPHPLSRFVLVW